MSKTLLKGGTVLSMDPEVGDLDVGDVLVEDGAISAVSSGAGSISVPLNRNSRAK